MNQTVIQLFGLLRSGLWKEQCKADLFDKETDWKTIFKTAQQQTVLGIVMDGLSDLPVDKLPERRMLLKVHSFLVRTVQHHHLLNEVIRELSFRLEEEGIRSVLLKGQGLALNYPDPMKRTCGDIDLYVGTHHYRKTCKLLQKWGMLKGEYQESIQHLHFEYRGVPVEIHRISGILYHPIQNRRFRQWSDRLLQSSNCRSADFGGQKVFLPPVRFDALFIFYHMHRHLITGGVGLRQLCDCTMYLHRFRNEIDRKLLYTDLCRMGQLRVWKLFGYIAVNLLGLPQEEFPFYSDSPKVREASLFMLEEIILRNGNFGHYNPDKKKRPKGYFAGKLFSLKNTLSYLRKVQQVFGSEAISFLCFYIYKGISNILKDVFCRKKKSQE